MTIMYGPGRALFFFFLLSCGLLGTASSSVAQDKDQLLFSIHGSNTVGAKLGPALAESYLKYLGADSIGVFPGDEENETRITGFIPSRNVMASIYVAAHGSSSGFKALANGRGQIAAASRPIKNKEQALLSDMGDFRKSGSEFVVGIDGLAIVVHPGNPINQLDLSQVARLFSGEIDNWNQLGGLDLPVRLFARDDRSGTWDTFKSLVLAKKYPLSPEAKRFESNQVLSGEVANTPGGIGFVSLNTIGDAKPLRISDGTRRALKPELINVATEDYVLSRRLFMYLPEHDSDPEARAFLEFVSSDTAQPVVAEVGYVPQSVKLMETDISSAPSNYKELVGRYERASVNFRFNQGKARLDNKALADVDRLARFLQRQPGDILLIGFAEKNDRANHSNLLARLRADVVRRALIRAGVPRKKIDSSGYGPYLALSSSNSLASRIRNRRVEVWIRLQDQVETDVMVATSAK
ncbi:MAG: phosphate ABC transporter substrate-binding/OmpA family protein [Endozoicomonas sp.]